VQHRRFELLCGSFIAFPFEDETFSLEFRGRITVMTPVRQLDCQPSAATGDTKYSISFREMPKGHVAWPLGTIQAIGRISM
jgi:hypothetical protein